MHYLVSNDDGYQSAWLGYLVEALESSGKVTVVAPDRDRSAASNSLTINLPLRAREAENGFICVDGTPTDCVHLAITGLLEDEPDMVVSGINMGANLGDDVLYSGTVAAATEGRFLGYPAMAVSMDAWQPVHSETAIKTVRYLLEQLHNQPLDSDIILNVNIPDIPWQDIKGFQATRLGHRHKAEPVVTMNDPRGEKIYWVGPAGPEQDAGPGTDFYAVRNGFVSVTPLQIDLTRHSAVDSVSSWLHGINL